ncbi:hypothetical protein K0M31_009599 [Melipona bicolor]|uniref:Uncharacterized protein n=1 Tax=Melipona bicolor TaxID=60889 RepID=A0AA40FND9_9HYME|nr:hypothetical protein K0M31_009599 [Melipona bicolor]
MKCQRNVPEKGKRSRPDLCDPISSEERVEEGNDEDYDDDDDDDDDDEEISRLVRGQANRVTQIQ